MENPELIKINNIQNQSKLSKSTKNAEKYTKISTDEENQEETQIDSISIEKEDVITSSSDFYSINPISIENQSYYYKRLGNTFSFFGDKNGDPLIIIGPHWPMYLCFCSCVSIGMILFFHYFWKYLHIFFQISGIIIYCTYFISYTYIFLMNPGFPKHDLDSRTGEPRGKFRFCGECKMWVNIEKKTNHCFDCNICVEEYDHHCPWTGKCIGKKNVNAFYVFVISILFIFAYIVCAITNAQSRMERE